MLKKGFALIELLFATVIISSIAGYGISKASGSVEETKVASISNDMVLATKIQTEQFALNQRYISVSGFSGVSKTVVSQEGISFPVSEGNYISMENVSCQDGSSGFFGKVSNSDIDDKAYYNSCENSSVVVSKKDLTFEDSLPVVEETEETVQEENVVVEDSEKISKENGNGNSNNPEDDNSDNGIDEDSNTSYTEEELSPLVESGVTENSPAVSTDKISKENGNGNSNNPEDDNTDNGIDEDTKSSEITVIEEQSPSESLTSPAVYEDPNLLDATTLSAAISEVKAMKTLPFNTCTGSEPTGQKEKIQSDYVYLYVYEAGSNYYACLTSK